MSEKCEKAMKYAKATNAMEGLYVTPKEKKLIKEHLERKITDE